MKSLDIGPGRIELVCGDITAQDTDAIVNAANSGLRGGGGVDGAIHHAGGPSIMAECRQHGGCATGDARVTGAGNLRARYVIHAVGPIYRDGQSGEPELLASAYRRCMEEAIRLSLVSIAFPSISTGAYGYPIEAAAAVALCTVAATLKEPLALARFVLFSAGDLTIYERCLGSLAGEIA